jgi:hypothetical protein
MRRLVGIAFLVGTAALSGCNAGGSSALGAGEPIDACGGVDALNALPEPDIANRHAIITYAAGALRVLDRIDTDRSVHTISDTKVPVPATVVTALKAETAAYQRLRAQVTAATTATKLHSVIQGFATSAAFAGADSTVELWAGNQCAI